MEKASIFVGVVKKGPPELMIHGGFQQVSYGNRKGGRAFQEVGIAYAKAPSKEDTWHIQRAKRKLLCMEYKGGGG